MPDFAQQHCVPCDGGVAPLAADDARGILEYVKGWVLAADGKKISRDFTFKDFKEALAFANTTGEIAESEGHHPDIYIWWNKVRLELSTHTINGLSTNDFIIAAKVNAILPA
ncbi:MAG: 4a-hydroxytetrahydrobiopterin dehydratase [Patescibacteria group bacterium]